MPGAEQKSAAERSPAAGGAARGTWALWGEQGAFYRRRVHSAVHQPLPGAGLHREFRGATPGMVAHSVPAGEEGAEGTMPSPRRARVAKPGRGEGRTESRSIWGSHPLHPVWKCLLPGVTHPHHRPAPMSRCHSALDLTPCWHRCRQITRSVPPVPGSAWNKPPRCVCFAF